MLKKVKIPRVVNYQTRAKEILDAIKTCKEGEGVEVPVEEGVRKDILQAALSREGRRNKIRVKTMTIGDNLVIFQQS